jgi:hypothetical protein
MHLHRTFLFVQLCWVAAAQAERHGVRAPIIRDKVPTVVTGLGAPGRHRFILLDAHDGNQTRVPHIWPGFGQMWD